MVTKKTVQKTSSSRTKKAAPKKSVKPDTSSFPIVGVGASAGGLEAFTQLLFSLPTEINMAFVFVQHLDPRHESMLADILAKSTKIPVQEVKDGLSVQPGRVYIIPPNTDMSILNGVLSLAPRKAARGQHMPIDHFFRSLAEDQKDRAIGIILSGTASDGTMGLSAIKEEGGLTFAQDEKSAKYDGMPHSAIAAGVVDFVLPPDKIARELVRIGQHPYAALLPARKGDEADLKGEDDFNRIFILLRNASGVDFSQYKPTTIKRRVARRMLLHRIEQLGNYVRYLKESPSELKELYQDLLINVTSFFRDKEVFSVLKTQVFPGLIKNRPANLPIRVWVPGCATGEEAYSIAICLVEYLSENVVYPIQIFATDVSEQAIDKARTGIYPQTAVQEISSERLRRFFIKVEGGYQISKNIRDMCVFARQDLAKDPPFSKMDIISCRNVLIYLSQALQKKILPTFHYSLNPNGFLLLGGSETVGGFADLFSMIDKKNKIYNKQMTPHRIHLDFAMSKYEAGKEEDGKKGAESVKGIFDLQKEADRLIIARFAPAGVLVNDNLDIMQFRGHTGDYLEPASGPASLSLLKMAREGLMLDLHSAIQEAKKKDIQVRRTNLHVKYNGSEHKEINLEVIPIKPSPISRERYFLVLFEEMALSPVQAMPKTISKPKKTSETKERPEEREVNKLRQELKATKEYLESTIEEQEATNEELRSALEEIQSSNEELQSTNEELETAKEELQSTNEELTTVNEELQNRNVELSQINNDIVNLLGSVNIPIVILGSDLTIRRFTPTAEKMLNLIPTDIGRPLSNLRPNMDIPDLDALLTEVIDTLTIKEVELQDQEGRWYSMRIRPYKTLDNKIDGVIITFIDIDVMKRSIKMIEEAYEYANAIVETVREPLVVLDADLRVKMANHSFYETFKIAKEDTENRFIYNIGEGQWNIPRLRELLEEILPKKSVLQNFEVDVDFPKIGQKRLSLNARRMVQAYNGVHLILLAMEEMNR